MYGKWKVISRAKHKKGYLTVKWRCLCTGCNREYDVFKSNLISGRSVQCPDCTLKEKLKPRKTNPRVGSVVLLYKQDINTGDKILLKIFSNLKIAETYREFKYGEEVYKKGIKLSVLYPLEKYRLLYSNDVFKEINKVHGPKINTKRY